MRLNKIKEILIQNDVRLFGFCKYKSVEKKLIECKGKKLLPEKAESIIVCAFPYKVSVGKHNISRYAIVRDYHLVVGNILMQVSNDLYSAFPGHQFNVFVDNSPIPEVFAAAKAGLGVIGKNGLLITKEFGSWVFIGEIVTDIDLEFEESAVGYCMDCGRCKKFCPSKSIEDNFVNRSTCVSNISQKKGVLSFDEQVLIKKSKSVWGCDICQEVCPLNFGKPYTYIKDFVDSAIPIIKVGDYKDLQDRAFQWRSEQVIERNLTLK